MTDVFSQSGTARSEIYAELATLRLTDPHTHINPHAPASTTLADLLGYHYYTELAHSAGMPKSSIEDKSIGPKELVERLVGGLAPLENTVQYSWLIEICKMFYGFEEDRLDQSNWEALYDRSESVMSSAQWPDMVLDQSNIEAVFLTNDFDDDLAGFDTNRYIPCLRTDDLVFHLADPVVRERLAKCTGVALDGSLTTLRESLRALFVHFVGHGARACAISLPPSFTPTSVTDGRATTALDAVLHRGVSAEASHRDALSRRVFWTLAELCDEFDLPFDLMIGVNRKVYPGGVYQGQDLFDSRVSLIQYRDLFNTFPDVKFPVSVLASVTNQELVSYAWIFPNVIPNGHWWYSNTPSTISHDLAARLEAVPQTKLIGYYSDAYKLEFVWPKFNMYRKVLSGVLADEFVRDRGWSVQRAVELGRRVLKQNTDEIFPRRELPDQEASRAADDGNENPVEVKTHPAAPTDQTGVSAAAATGLDTLEEPSPVELADIDLHDPLTTLEDETTRVEEPMIGGEHSPSSRNELLETENPGESFDTVIMDPIAIDESATPVASEPSGAAENDSSNVESDEFDAAETFDSEHDLRGANESPEIPPTPTFAEDAAATVIEKRSKDAAELRAVELKDAEKEAPKPEPESYSPDPLPLNDEIEELDLDDVEILDPSKDPGHDAETMGAVLDDVPLDLGDLTDASSQSEVQPAAGNENKASSENEGASEVPQIQQLRGETSFSPDEDSLQLQPDPLTGELRFGALADSPDKPSGEESSGESGAAATEDASEKMESKDEDFDLNWLSDDDDKDPAK